MASSPPVWFPRNEVDIRRTLASCESWLDSKPHADLAKLELRVLADEIARVLDVIRDERFADGPIVVRRRADEVRGEIRVLYEHVLGEWFDASGDANDEIARLLADSLVARRRLEEAATIYMRLTKARRGRRDLLAFAHYLRGLQLLEEGARAEGRLELRRALHLDPTLVRAQAALDGMHTTKLEKLRPE